MSTHNLCFEQKYEKYQNFLSENFPFLVVKFSVYLNRRVFIMIRKFLIFINRKYSDVCGKYQYKEKPLKHQMLASVAQLDAGLVGYQEVLG